MILFTNGLIKCCNYE